MGWGRKRPSHWSLILERCNEPVAGVARRPAGGKGIGDADCRIVSVRFVVVPSRASSLPHEIAVKSGSEPARDKAGTIRENLNLGHRRNHRRPLAHLEIPRRQLRVRRAPVQVRMAQVHVTQGTCHADRGHVKVAGQLGDGVFFQQRQGATKSVALAVDCLLYTSPSPRDGLLSRMPSSA